MRKLKSSILLIDDDSIFNLINKKILEKKNLAESVNSYCNANIALKELIVISESGGNNFPEVIFLDINMPRMDGWEFLDEFEKIPDEIIRKCDVFMLSSSIDPRDIARAKSYKTVKDFISKPLSTEILEEIFT